ncbi:MAG: hypothetical protein ACLFWI_12410 [Coleofasciculus sp.]|uniref:hypothetical protein n=1 Tax=Coleofasciculus sp. TaxID=3100458 RepID=UPI003A243FAC
MSIKKGFFGAEPPVRYQLQSGYCYQKVSEGIKRYHNQTVGSEIYPIFATAIEIAATQTKSACAD